MSKQSAVESSQVSLDSVFQAMKHWRDNKHAYDAPGIPNDVWISIFQLEEQGYSQNELRRMFGLNSEQYKKKRSQHYPEENEACDPKPVKEGIKPNAQALFGEAVVATPMVQGSIPPLTQAIQQSKQAITRLKSPDNQPERYLDPMTIIVECIRPDGHRLKIHTTNNSLEVVMQNFFSQEVTP